MITSVLYYVKNYLGEWETFSGNSTLFLVIVWVIYVIAFSVIWGIKNMRLKNINEKTELKEKLSEYRLILITKFVLLEAPTIVSIVLYFVSWDIRLLLSAIVMIIVFIGNKPDKNKIIESLNLNSADKIRIENPDEIVAEIETKY